MLFPIEHYMNCRVLDLPRRTTDASCRHGYGVPVLDYWGASCAYCGRDLAESYEAWLDVSVDHVVPAGTLAVWGEDYRKHLGSLANLVPCCRACNEFLNGYRINDIAPSDGDWFFAVRDRALREKREMALSRHSREREAYESWLGSSVRETA